MIGIIGAGITGLSLAWQLKKHQIPFVIFDDSPGGLIYTEYKNGFLLENGPNSLILTAELEQLIEETGFTNQVIQPSNIAKKRFILFNGKPIALPSGPLSLLINPLFSWSSLLNLWKERKNSTKSVENETVAQFFDRRFGKEIRENLVNPFVSGIYAGDPEKMLMSLSFPKLIEMERQYGSVIKGFMKSKSRQKTINFTNGIGSFINHLTKKVEEHLIREKVYRIEKREQTWLINANIHCSDIVLCTPAYVTANVLKPFYPELSNTLTSIYYPPVSQVYLAFSDTSLEKKTQGFGLLSPAFEKSFALGILFSSQLFENRAPQGKQLLTAFVGGARNPDFALLPENEIVTKTTQEIQRVFQVTTQPVFSKLKTYAMAIPQPDEQMKKARKLAKNLESSIHLAGNWMSGVAVSDCVSFAIQLADKFIKNKNGR